jgi:hypothetical protein
MDSYQKGMPATGAAEIAGRGTPVTTNGRQANPNEGKLPNEKESSNCIWQWLWKWAGPKETAKIQSN